MAKWVHSSVLDDGLNKIKTAATKQILLDAYTAGDSYATVISNKVAEATMASGDYTLASSGSNRTLTTATKSGTATADADGTTPDLHIAFTNGTDTVLWVTDETSNVDVATGATVNFPSLVYTSSQPT